jgi:hypothetical protein
MLLLEKKLKSIDLFMENETIIFFSKYKTVLFLTISILHRAFLKALRARTARKHVNYCPEISCA